MRVLQTPHVWFDSTKCVLIKAHTMLSAWCQRVLNRGDNPTREMWNHYCKKMDSLWSHPVTGRRNNWCFFFKQVYLAFITCSLLYGFFILTEYDKIKRSYHASSKRKEMFHLTMHYILFTVIWCWTYGKGPLRWWERKPVVAITLSD